MRTASQDLSDGAVVPTYFTEAERMWLRILGPKAWCVAAELHLLVVKLKADQVDATDVARRLGMTEAEVGIAVSRLLRYGVLIRRQDAFVIPTSFPMPTPNQVDYWRRRTGGDDQW